MLPSLSPVKQRETRLAARRTTKLDLDLFHTEVRMAADVARTHIHPSLHFGRKWTPRCISKGPADRHNQGRSKRERKRALPLSVCASPISSSDQKLMGHEFPERRKKVPPTEPARENIARSQQRGGQRDKEIHPLSHSLSRSVCLSGSRCSPDSGQSSSARLDSP